MLATRSYGLLSTTIRVASDTVDVLNWLDQFLTPSLERRDAETPDYTVAVHIDAARYEAIYQTHHSGQLPLVPCFALDQEVVHHPHWMSDGRTIVADEKYEALYLLTGSQVEILVRPGAPRLRMAAIRVVRELALEGALADERRILLHSASLEIEGQGVLLAGSKGSGKSTLLCHLAASTGSPILANDRSLVTLFETGMEVRGIPTIVSIRPGTRDLMPGIFTDASPEASPAPDAILKLSMAELADALRVSLAGVARLSAVAFPEHHQDPLGLQIERLPISEVRDRLLQVRFGIHSGKKERTVFECLAGGSRSSIADEKLIEQIAAKIPSFSLKVGGGVLRDKTTGERIVAAIRDSWSFNTEQNEVAS
jgi:hypothetical protein